MPDLRFDVEGAEAVPHAAAPTLHFRLRITDPVRPPAPVHGVMLRCQIRIEPARRRYQPGEQDRLLELFGEPQHWGQTLRPMLWTHAGAFIPAFEGSTVVELPVPCTYDFNVGAAKYFYALEDGEVPLCLLFSGTVFHRTPDGGLQAGPIPWDREAAFRLPVRVWKDMMEQYYPNSVWLCLPRNVFDRLYAYKRSRVLPTWEQTLDTLLAAADREVGVGPAGAARKPGILPVGGEVAR